MENPAFQIDEPSPPSPSPSPIIPSESAIIDIAANNIKPKKKNSVAFAVDDEQVEKIQKTILSGICLQQLHPELNLSPLIELLGNALSFQLTTKYLVCVPHMTLTPLQLQSTAGNSSPNGTGTGGSVIRIQATKRFNWCLCCCMNSLNSQVVSISKEEEAEDNQNVLSFIYGVHIWCPAKSNEERLVDIFLSGMNERLGYIDTGRDVGIGSEITCGLTQEKFITRQVDEKGCPRSFKIENSAGLEIANGKVTTSAWMNGLGLQRWSGFQFNFVPSEIETLTHPTRAVLLVTFLLWVIDAREKKQWQYIWTIVFILFLLTSFLLIHFFGPEK